jgi:hypothetical protein
LQEVRGEGGIRYPSKDEVRGRQEQPEEEDLRNSSLRGGQAPSQLASIMGDIRRGLQSLATGENEKISSLIMMLVDYYQYHIKRLKNMVKEKQQELLISEQNMEGLRGLAQALKGDNDGLKLGDRGLHSAIEELRHLIIEKEKEVSRLRMHLEEEKSKAFKCRISEQDMLEQLDKVKREIAGMRELNQIKDDEISYLKKNLRGLEEEVIDLRDHKRELQVKIDKLIVQPLNDEKTQIEKSSLYLVEQINSLKRELFKAKSVVESYKYEKENEKKEYNKNVILERERQEQFFNMLAERDRRSVQGTPTKNEEDLGRKSTDPRTRDRLNASFNLDVGSRGEDLRNSPKRNPRGVGVPEKAYSKDDLEKELGADLGRRRLNLRDRRHEVALDQDARGGSVGPHGAQGSGDNTHGHGQQHPGRRDPNRGHGDLLGQPSLDEVAGRGGLRAERRPGQLDTPRRQRLQQEIGKYYCKRVLSQAKN